ncbi:hypothetical protein H0A36_17445 [Endozoicomonas sp. SM1973]|uniref:ABC transporter substrate-binding protein n=1 Tax=Spartinivicinus marinus TaxID=2994442 RepID=A0A853ICZ9_9GAMM|nr:hypothetical protein [Spartinivicinus marinus]MCX4030158.1 hypothetical protein [Spartinivicinus marinus]NYZ67801.1 hypothetical protein [Spartinivicinus marinus]
MYKLIASIRVLIGLIAMLVSNQTSALDLWIVELNNASSQAKKVVRELSEKLSLKINAAPKKIIVDKIKNLDPTKNILITLGSDSFENVLSKNSNIPVLATFISKHSFQIISKKYNHSNSISAIYSDPSPFRQIALIKTLYGANATAGIINTEYVSTYINEYKTASTKLGVKLFISELRDGGAAETLKYLNNTRSLILVKDRALFSKISVEQILIKAYDLNQQGIIGFSRSLVKSGGLATTYSTIENISSSIYYEFNKFNEFHEFSKPDYSRFYEVISNKYVIRSLNVVGINEKQLKRSIQQYEKRQVKL